MQVKPFIPPNLPPQLDLSSILKLAIGARDAVVRYDESVKRLPNPGLIRRSFETKEAVLSSKIEGTQASLREVFEHDAKKIKGRTTDKQRDVEEIINYRLAINEGHELLLQGGGISVELIQKLHAILLNSVRGKDNQPGKFRQEQVYIGRPGGTIEEAVYIPPPYTEVGRLMKNLASYLDSDYKDVDTLIQSAVAHYQFEAIHPFEDGNGRIGRLLISLYLYEKKLTHLPSLYISEFLERYRREYYEALKLVSEEEAWIDWISFFLRAVRSQAEISKERVIKIEELYEKLRLDLPKFNSKYAGDFLEALFKIPIFSIRDIAKEAKINNMQTAYSLLDKFLEAGLISQLDGQSAKTKRILVFEDLLKLLD